jgi:hypothetical protein
VTSTKLPTQHLCYGSLRMVILAELAQNLSRRMGDHC